jgi:spore maturation protein CgeB
MGLNIAFFGSSLVSTYWNGAATYYRGLIRALHARGHRTTFYEPDAFERQQHRDMPEPRWACVVVYSADHDGVYRALEAARGADLVIKASGVGVFDAWLEREVLSLQGPRTRVAFWDVDAPATLVRVQDNLRDEFRALIPRYDLILTYGGGAPVIDAYRALGARECVPIYNALDTSTHYPVAPDPRFEALLGFLGNRLPDREARVAEFFFKPAQCLPKQQFLLGGSGWEPHAIGLPNVRYIGHVGSGDHNAFNRTPRAILNINRESMARIGFSPPTRVFEAAGAGACLITDAWLGLDEFLEPGYEVLVAQNGEEVAELVTTLSAKRAREIGAAAFKRICAEHTYAHRARQVEQVLTGETSFRQTISSCL